jgi:hypothetical protein
MSLIGGFIRGAACTLLVLVAFVAAAQPGGNARPHPESRIESALTRLLARHVHWNEAGTNTRVDYAGVRRDRLALQAVLDEMAKVPKATFDRWPAARRQAFLINAYNAHTLALITDAGPDTASIRDLGSLLRSPWERPIAPLLGRKRTLDDIEHGLLRGAPDFAEPRIHFAVNCASIGCPALRPEAYSAATLSAQLDDQTRRFLRDRSRNHVVSLRPLRLQVSSIFDWYAKDFGVAGGTRAFLARYADELGLDPAAVKALRSGTGDVDYLDYDWRLNSRTPR